MKHVGKQVGITTRECSKCGCDLGGRYGKQRYCKACHAAYMRENRVSYSSLSEEQRRKAITRAYTRQLIKRGHIIRGICEVCGESMVEPHHDDYNNPRQVRWFCREHHLKLHNS